VPDLAAAGTRAASRVAERSLELSPPKAAEPDDRSIHAPFVVADPNARTAGMIREGLGADRVQRGLVDPYFHTLGAAMAEQWRAEEQVDAKGMSGFLKEAARGMKAGAKAWGRAWAHAASQYGATGTVDLGQAFDAQRRLLDNIPHGYTEQVPGQLKSSRIALVRLVQRPNGKLLHVELVQPSIDPDMDAEIMRELRTGQMVMPVPPVSGQGIHDPIRSVWAFQLVVSIAPPIPALSGSFDLQSIFDPGWRRAHGSSLDMQLPLSRRIEKHVDLVSVE